MPKGHRLSQNKSISVFHLNDVPIVLCNPLNAPLSMCAFQQQLLEHHSEKNIIYCESIEIAHSMVLAGMGVCVLPSILCLKIPDLSVVDLEDTVQLSFGVLYHNQNTNPLLKEFLKML